MRTVTSERLQTGLAAIAALDLTNVCRKIREPEPEGKGWTVEQTAQAELWYKRYLELCLRYPDVPVVPNYPIDMIWHQHILDTWAYGKDCDAIFGEMLHHYPYFGLNGDADVRDNSFDVTNELYRKHFGEDCMRMKFFGSSVPEDCTLAMNCGDGSGCRSGDDIAECSDRLFSKGVNCNSGGSGTGCGQGCSRGGSYESQGLGFGFGMPNMVAVASSCGHGGSGTGCGQGCRR
jgi:hypothetical protein